MSSRNGKIAKLPIQLCEQINVRISEGATLKSLLAWLNSDPAVVAILNTHFGGRSISQQNMSEWRLGGYEEWLTNQEYFADARAFAERRKFLDCSGISAEDLLVVITARWARLMDRMGEMDIIDFNCSVARWQRFTQSAAILRKLELQKARLELDRETRQPKSGKKGAAASSSPESSAPSEPASPESGADNSLQSDPVSGGSLFSPGVPCDPDEMIELSDDYLLDEEEQAWQTLGDPPPPPKPIPNPYSHMRFRTPSPDAGLVTADCALPSHTSTDSQKPVSKSIPDAKPATADSALPSNTSRDSQKPVSKSVPDAKPATAESPLPANTSKDSQKPVSKSVPDAEPATTDPALPSNASRDSQKSVPDAKPTPADSAPPSNSSRNSQKPVSSPAFNEMIQAVLQARIQAGEDKEPKSAPSRVR